MTELTLFDLALAFLVIPGLLISLLIGVGVGMASKFNHWTVKYAEVSLMCSILAPGTAAQTAMVLGGCPMQHATALIILAGLVPGLVFWVLGLGIAEYLYAIRLTKPIADRE